MGGVPDGGWVKACVHARPSWPSQNAMHRRHARPSLPVVPDPNPTPLNLYPTELHDTAAIACFNY